MTDGPTSWLPDAHPNFPAEDAFGVDELIDRLVDELADATPPFAVSLSGSWGVGKSTVARELVARLRERGVRCVFVDVWNLEVRQLRRHLVLEVGAALETSDPGDLPTKEERQKVAGKIDAAEMQTTVQDAARVELRSIGDIVEAIALRPWTLVLTASLVGGLLWLAVQRGGGLDQFLLTVAGVMFLALLTTFVLRLSTPSRSKAPVASEVLLSELFRDTVTKAPRRRWLFGKTEPMPVAVVVDNLDRLTGEDALAALSQIRALLDIKGSRCLFVIPIDRRRLTVHLQDALHGDQSLGGSATADVVETAHDYLEKFFGLDLALTQPEPVDLRRWAKEQARRVAPGVGEPELERLADVVVEAGGRSPRLITRIINGAVTRHRIVTGMGRSLSLPQAAILEGVLLLAPDSLRHLETNPRALTDARQAIAQGLSHARRSVAVAMGAQIAEDEKLSAEGVSVHRFLQRTLQVPLRWEDVRIALALRKNRLWNAVPDWEVFSDPMEEGDAEAFAAALADRADREAVLRSAVDALVQLGSSTRLLAGIHALAPHLDASVPRVVELRDLASRYLGSESWAFRWVSVAVARLLFGEDRSGSASHVESLVRALGMPDTPHNEGLIRAAILLRSKASDADVKSIGQALATWSRDELAPLFGDPAGVSFIDGAVAETLVAPLVAWDPGVAGPQSELVSNAMLLRKARDHGWNDPSALDNIAAQMTQGITQIAANQEAIAVGEAVMRLLESSETSTAIDTLGQGLAQKVGDRNFFAWAFRLKLSEAALSTAASRFDTWAKAEDLNSVKPVLDEHRELIDETESNYRQLLLGRWQTHGHALAATMAIDGSPTGTADLVQAWRGVAADQVLPRALQAMQLLTNRKDEAAVRQIAGELDDGITKAPESLPGLGELLTWMIAQKLSRQALVAGLKAKAAGVATASDLGEVLAAVAPILSKLGNVQAATVADALAEEMTGFDLFEPAATGRVAASMSQTARREDLVVKLVSAGHNLDATLDALELARSAIGTSAAVREALIARAAGEGDQARAHRDLEEAGKWKRGRAKLSEAADADLNDVYSQFPDLRDAELNP